MIFDSAARWHNFLLVDLRVTTYSKADVVVTVIGCIFGAEGCNSCKMSVTPGATTYHTGLLDFIFKLYHFCRPLRRER